jgi:hypothetical protein
MFATIHVGKMRQTPIAVHKSSLANSVPAFLIVIGKRHPRIALDCGGNDAGTKFA